MDLELKKYLQEGEGVQLDYKETITSANKIAKTLAAFSNTEGGVILIGIKDNKTICGIIPEEEKFMINLANDKYCKPKANIEFSEYEYEGKTVLKVNVEKGTEKPYKAKDEQGNWKAFVRVEDNTMLASVVWYKSEMLRKEGLGNFEFNDLDRRIIEQIKNNGPIELMDLINNIPYGSKQIIDSLSLLVYLNHIQIVYQNRIEMFKIV